MACERPVARGTWARRVGEVAASLAFNTSPLKSSQVSRSPCRRSTLQGENWEQVVATRGPTLRSRSYQYGLPRHF